ncbi:MAG: hypothetical protein ACRC7O_12220, partial [Fimbriiglobus sp.]
MVPALLLLLAVSPAADAPRFTVHAADGKPRISAVTKLGPDGLTFADGMTIPAADLVAIRRLGRPLPGYPREPQLLLANGDRIPGTVVGGDAKTIRVRTPFAADPWAAPLSALAAVWLVAPPADTPPDVARYPWRPAGSRSDSVLLRNG